MPKIDFILSNKERFEIIVPNVDQKFTYYYEPTENLHRHDEVKMFFISEEFRWELGEDQLGPMLSQFKFVLDQALNQELSLNYINHKNFGIAVNNWYYYIINEDYGKYLIHSTTQPLQAALYNFAGKIFLEIFPLYPWTYRDPELSEQYYSYDEFIKNYKPYIVQEIPVNVAQQWQLQCKELLISINYDF